MSTELLLFGFIRAAATELVKQAGAPALLAVAGKTTAGVAAPADAWPQGLTGLQLQNEVLWRLHDLDAVLPARAGTIFASEDDLQDLVERYNNEIAGRLELVAGKVELGLEVRAPNGYRNFTPALSPGRRYLQRLGGAVCDSGPIGVFCTQLNRRLKEISTEGERLVCLRANTIFRASYLVPKENTATFRDIVTEEVGRMRELEFLITGPWPPYSFSHLELYKDQRKSGVIPDQPG
ncbi:MAG: GvpL/GvpF family gas vesicle protein [Bacillota bacterium]